MKTTVAVLAQVPAEAQCLAETLPSLARLGRVVLVNADAGDAVTAEAERLGFPVTGTPWVADRGALFTAVLELFAGAARALAHADEQLDQPGDGGWRDLPGPASASVVHRTGKQHGYVEEDEARCAPGGAGFRVRGRTHPRPVVGGEPVAVGDLPRSGIVFSHHPARWPGLAEQRIGRTLRIHEAALRESPGDTDALYGLFRGYCSLRDWERVREAGARWREAAAPGDPNRPMVDYQEARVALATGDARSAQALVEAAVAVAPRFADAWYLLGELHAAHGRDTGADAAFTRAGEIGRTAEPVAAEDLSLATWRPLQARAALAKRAGRTAEADDLLERARTVRREMRVAMGPPR